jgi:hypothetical protein
VPDGVLAVSSELQQMWSNNVQAVMIREAGVSFEDVQQFQALRRAVHLMNELRVETFVGSQRISENLGSDSTCSLTWPCRDAFLRLSLTLVRTLPPRSRTPTTIVFSLPEIVPDDGFIPDNVGR